jgi:hypothetical protein
MLTPDSIPRTEPSAKRRADRSPRTATPEQKLLTGTQIEQEYGIPYRSVYDLYLHSQLAAVRFRENGRLWFKRQDIEALIERSTERA